MKANRAKAGLKIGLRWKDGRFIREDEKSAVSVMQGAADEELFLELLDKSTRNGIDVHVAPGRGYAPDSFAEQERARELGVGKERFKRPCNAYSTAKGYATRNSGHRPSVGTS